MTRCFRIARESVVGTPSAVRGEAISSRWPSRGASDSEGREIQPIGRPKHLTKKGHISPELPLFGMYVATAISERAFFGQTRLEIHLIDFFNAVTCRARQVKQYKRAKNTIEAKFCVSPSPCCCPQHGVLSGAGVKTLPRSF